ncbi:MAG: hypothetical protein DSY46_07510 [Hydrogenimonas sp.]|nr:MAG: hypothetical protein DSY46_07510 [Hydrogenimonas sp.]
MKQIKMSLVAAIVAATTTGANAGALDTVLSNPKLSIELRPRYEYANIHQDGTDAASALTVRTSIDVQAGLMNVEGLNVELQAISVDNFGLVTDYTPENGSYDKIADPTQTRMTQANISYAKDGFVGIVGRKMVGLDNHRFIGTVGWRQMPQSYDLAAAIYNYDKMSLLAAYVTRVNRVTTTTIDTGSVLLHAAYNLMPELQLTAYDYMIQNFADHVGLRATGKMTIDDIALKYTAEFAMQNDPTMTDDNDPILANATSAGNITQDATYYNLAVDASFQNYTVGVGYEVLGEKGSGNNAFYTPLATLHGKNGWADRFLTGTPDNGLVDMSLKVAYNAGAYGKLVGVYHNFSSDARSIDYGTEFDAAYKMKVNKNLDLLLKSAWYNTDASTSTSEAWTHDTTKYWVQFDYKFNAQL